MGLIAMIIVFFLNDRGGFDPNADFILFFPKCEF